MYHEVSKEIFEMLNSTLPVSGGTKFSLGDLEFDVSGKDGLGGLIEEWFGLWAVNNGFSIYDPKRFGNSQSFPDYYVGYENDGLLEIKSFDYSTSPNFDIANFESYYESISVNPDRVNSDYIIFGYELIETTLTIKHVWLKKIWEITCPSARWPLKTQTKRGVIYNIRPSTWYSSNCLYPSFNSKEEFIYALIETYSRYKDI